MEKKEREELWGRLAPHSARQELTNNIPFERVVDGVGREILLDFISQELDKAREEGYDEGFDDCFEDLLCKYDASGKRLFTRWFDEEISKLNNK